MTIEVSASILSADFANLGQEVSKLSNNGADYIHIDVMDGVFVPNITMGTSIISAIRPYSKLPFDVHLMIQSPSKYIENFVKAGADIITIHMEAEVHLEKTIRQIKSYGKKAGISLVPSTHPNNLEYIIRELDIILIMSVNPGFGGQKFISSQLSKIRYVRNMIDSYSLNTKIEVDGGVTIENSKRIIEAGANILAVGSTILHSHDMKSAIKKLKQSI